MENQKLFMNKYITILSLILVMLVSSSMIPFISTPRVEDLKIILQRYNYMDYEYIVNLYKEGRIFQDSPQMTYITVVSLFKLSNYQDVLKFTNSKVSDEFLDNNIKLLCAFSLSEVGEFESSMKLLREVTKKMYLNYYDDLLAYYQFRNSLFLEDIEDLLVLRLPTKLDIKDEEINQILKIIQNNPKNERLVLTLLRSIPSKVSQQKISNIITTVLEITKTTNKEVAQQIIRLKFEKEGYSILLNSVTNEIEKMYYQAKLFYLNGEIKKSLDIVKKIEWYYTQKKLSQIIPFDDVKIFEIDCYSKLLNSQEYNELIMKELPVSSKKVISYTLSKYNLLKPDVHLSVMENFVRKTDFSNLDYKYIRSFISYHLNEGNLELVRKFVDLMLNVSKNTDWEREFLALKYRFSESNEEKTNLIVKIIKDYPMTYEYYTVLSDIKRDKTLFDHITNNLIVLYSQIRENTNVNLDGLNSLIGTSLALKILEVTNTLESDINFVLKNASIKFDTSSNTNKLPEYLDELYKHGLMVDLYMELEKLSRRLDVSYLNYYSKFESTSMVCKTIESFGFSRNIYFKRGVFFTYFKNYLYPTPYYNEIIKNCKKYSVDLPLVYGVMRSESRYSPFVLSIANAVGLMQLITPTASSVGKKFLNLDKNLNILDVYVIDRNIELGIAHIRELTDFFKEYPENLKEVLIVSSYNAGTTSVLKWYRSLKTSDPLMFVEGIRYLETYNYTKNVIENRYFYENFILKDF